MGKYDYDYEESIKKTNLNELTITNVDGGPNPTLSNNGIFKNNIYAVEVVFRDIKDKLKMHIKEADVVVGCVAWLTSEDIIEELAKKKVSIIVQKEDFLRPDMSYNKGNGEWKRKLRNMYNSIPHSMSRLDEDIPSPLRSMSYCSDDIIHSIRCCGVYNNSKQKPNMHNKFLIFCKEIKKPYDVALNDYIKENKNEDNVYDLIKSFKQQYDQHKYIINTIPYAVWTGSFNFSKNSELSFENVIIIHDKDIAQKYFEEWANICALSEPLDWESEYIEPEWRIGS
jgi:uncharacterized protein YeeX (DUF496 family)